MKYHIPKNKRPLDSLYAVLSRDEDGTEGIVALMTPEGSLPFVFGDKDMLEKMRPLIKQCTKDTGRKLYIMKYKKEEQLEIVDFLN